MPSTTIEWLSDILTGSSNVSYWCLYLLTSALALSATFVNLGSRLYTEWYIYSDTTGRYYQKQKPDEHGVAYSIFERLLLYRQYYSYSVTWSDVIRLSAYSIIPGLNAGLFIMLMWCGGLFVVRGLRIWLSQYDTLILKRPTAKE